MRKALLSLSLGLVAASSQGAVVISEMYYGIGNAANEFIELETSTPNQSLSGYALLAIAVGDVDGNRGKLRKTFYLDNFSTGSNGLLLLRNTTSNTLFPDPDPATTIGVLDFASKPTGDTSTAPSNSLPDSAMLWLLVSGFDETDVAALPTTPNFGHKTFDLDEDGILDSQPWTQLHYGFLYLDATEGLTSYAEGLTFNLNGMDIDVPILGSDEVFIDEIATAVIRTPDYPANDGLINVGVSGSPSAGYLVDPAAYPTDPEYFPDRDYYLSPGRRNEYLMIPEPATAALLVMGLAGLATMRRRS